MEQPVVIDEAVNLAESGPDRGGELALPKKKFLAPEILAPVDVLEATTFFQLTDSGTTN